MSVAKQNLKAALFFAAKIAELQAEVERLRKKYKDEEFSTNKNCLCPVCGRENGEHVTIGGTVQQEPLTVEDWAELHEFVFNKTLAETHRIITRARARKER